MVCLSMERKITVSMTVQMHLDQPGDREKYGQTSAHITCGHHLGVDAPWSARMHRDTWTEKSLNSKCRCTLTSQVTNRNRDRQKLILPGVIISVWMHLDQLGCTEKHGQTKG